MNKTEFIAAIAEEAGLSKTDAAKAVKAFKDSVSRIRNIRSFKET